MAIEVGKGSYLRPIAMRDGRSNGSYTGTPLTRLEGEDIEGLEYPVMPGETLYAEFQLDFRGDSEQNVSIVIKTPPDPNGGFFLTGASVHDNSTQNPNGWNTGDYGKETTYSYGADRFNEPVGVWRCGTPNGEEGGWNTARGRIHLANSDNPGLVKIQLRQPMLVSGLTRNWFGGGITDLDDAPIGQQVLNFSGESSVLGTPQKTLPDYNLVCVSQNWIGGPIPSTPTLAGGSYTWTTLLDSTFSETRVTIFASPIPAADIKGEQAITVTFPSYPNITQWTAGCLQLHGANSIVTSASTTGTGSSISLPFTAANQRNIIAVCLFREVDVALNLPVWVGPGPGTGNHLTGNQLSNFGPGTLSDGDSANEGLPGLAIQNRALALVDEAYAYQLTSPVVYSWTEGAAPYLGLIIEFTNKYL